MSRSTHVDREIHVFYAIVEGACAIAAVVVLISGEWIGLVVVLSVMLGFAVLGWPISATVLPEGAVRFDSPLRRALVSAGDIRRVKFVRSPVGDRVTLKLNARSVPLVGYRPDVGYRLHDFSNPAQLARAVARIADASPGCVWDDRARRLLEASAP